MKSAPRRLQTLARSPCFQARTRKPSCLTSCGGSARLAQRARGGALATQDAGALHD